MKLAEIYVNRPSALNVPKWKWLLPVCLIGLALTGVMGCAGFPWRLYNDIPSLFGYASLALIIYKIEITPINRFFSYTNKFSYEWYLVHILVFQIVWHLMDGKFCTVIEMSICLSLSYVLAIFYAKLFVKKSNK